MSAEFDPPEFDRHAATYDGGTMYQYRLDPAESNWSEWTREPFTEFTNLFEGDYRLLVRTLPSRLVTSSPRARVTPL